MFAITGITGKVGGQIAKHLLAADLPVRAVMRDADKGAVWGDRGCDIALANMDDARALTAAFEGTEGVFVLFPPIFDPSPGFPEALATVAAMRSALESARPKKVVCLSTIGAQATRPSLLTQLTIMEKSLGELSVPITFLRAAWFMENCSWDVAPAREKGVISSFLQPLDKPVPMVATADIARLAAAQLQETWSGRRIVELEGPHRVSPNEIAVTFSGIMRRPVRIEAVPREKWEGLFNATGMKNPTPRIQMIDGFNQGWIEFEGGEAGSKKGRTTLETALAALIVKDADAATGRGGRKEVETPGLLRSGERAGADSNPT